MEIPAWHLVLVQLATFLVGVVLLHGLAWKPIRAILTERRERILALHADAEGLKRQAQGINDDLRARIEKLEGEVRARMLLAEGEAKALREKSEAAASLAAKAVVTQARESMKAERVKLLAEMRAQVASLSVKMAREVAVLELSAGDKQRLVKRVLDRLPKKLGVDA